MQDPFPIHRGRAVLALFLAAVFAGAAQARSAPDLIDVTVVSIEGASAEQCAERITGAVAQARTISLGTSIQGLPYDLGEGLRSFYDHVLPLDAGGEHRSTALLSSSYVAGHATGGVPLRRNVIPFLRVEVARPAGTPPDAPSRISIAWLWLQRLAEAPGPAGAPPVQRPLVHRFDFAGEVETRFGVWGSAVAPCRQGGDGAWFGAVAVWTYLAP